MKKENRGDVERCEGETIRREEWWRNKGEGGTEKENGGAEKSKETERERETCMTHTLSPHHCPSSAVVEYWSLCLCL